jgi:hypothetical protein
VHAVDAEHRVAARNRRCPRLLVHAHAAAPRFGDLRLGSSGIRRSADGNRFIVLRQWRIILINPIRFDIIDNLRIMIIRIILINPIRFDIIDNVRIMIT